MLRYPFRGITSEYALPLYLTAEVNRQQNLHLLMRLWCFKHRTLPSAFSPVYSNANYYRIHANTPTIIGRPCDP